MQAAPAAARPGPVSGTHFADTGFEPSISGDGRFVAYAGGPAATFQNGPQIYLRDRTRRVTSLVSVSVVGGQPDAQSLNPAVSSSGRYIAFQSDANTLVTGDNNDVTDVFVRDRTARTTTRVSVGAAGVEADGASELPSISADGRVVAFVSSAGNLGGPGGAGSRNVFVRDLDAGTTTRVSIGLGGAPPDGPSFAPAVSGDGATVVFASAASNLVSGDTNGRVDVFAFNRATGTTRRVSVTPAGDQADGDTLVGNGRPVANSDASVFAFGTNAPNLLGGGPPEFDVVARDLAANTVQRLSTHGQIDNIYEETESSGPSMSADGRRVAFAAAGSLAPSYLDGSPIDVFVRDRLTGSLTRVSQKSQCEPAFDVNGFPSISADGRWVAFQSTSISLLQPGVYRGGLAPPLHVYVASARPPRSTEICALSVRPRTIHPSVGGSIGITLSRRGGFRIRIYRVRPHNKLQRRATITGRGFDPGSHSFAFNGRIRGHTLGPGTFVAIASGSARGAPTKRARFEIRRP